MGRYPKDKMRKYITKWRAARKSLAMQKLGSICSQCGSSKKLHFDHIKPETKVTNIGRLWTASSQKFWAEIAKCQLLCTDCHKKKTALEPNKLRKFTHGRVRMYQRGCRCSKCKEVKRLSRKPRAVGTVA